MFISKIMCRDVQIIKTLPYEGTVTDCESNCYGKSATPLVVAKLGNPFAGPYSFLHLS